MRGGENFHQPTIGGFKNKNSSGLKALLGRNFRNCKNLLAYHFSVLARSCPLQAYFMTHLAYYVLKNLIC